MTTVQKLNHLIELGMTNSDIARVTKYSTTYISGVRRGSADAGRPFRKAVSRAYKVITTNTVEYSEPVIEDEVSQLKAKIAELQSKLDAINEIIGK